MRKTHLVVGYLGEVGRALYKVIKKAGQSVNGRDITATEGWIEGKTFDFIHICIPDSDDFKVIVSQYIGEYQHADTITIIHSTVDPLTTSPISDYYPRIAYSPVRGLHPHLAKHLKTFPKFFSTTNEEIVTPIMNMYKSIGITSVSKLEEPDSLEWAKPLNTLLYAYLITFSQEVIRLADHHGLNKETIFDFIVTTGDRTLLPYAQKIGGHCLIKNAELLAKYTRFASFIISNDKIFGTIYGDEKKYFKEKDGRKRPVFSKD